MHGIIDIAPGDRIMVHILQFLSHHRLPLDLLRVRTFLPALMIPVDFVPGLVEGEQFQHRRMALGQALDDLCPAVKDLKLAIVWPRSAAAASRWQ